ncbi:WavE lipopolysaccharide synthesis family protein [Nitrosopumilus sp.]|nr:WavE lipopolysaccharide synthesis family protein [Nitrosopumilus sp.]
MTNSKTGILLQGRVSEWTRSIIKEYQINFPESEILLQTFSKDISDISCKVIQSKNPKPTSPFQGTTNFQVKGSQEGLKNMNADIVMKCRSDLFVHNSNIFEVFFKENTLEKIMYAEFDLKKEEQEYWIADFIQLSSRKTLLEFWNNTPFDDGKAKIDIEPWLTRNYLLNTKKDSREWDSIRHEYFIPKGYHDVFEIEWEKVVKFKHYQEDLLRHSTI